jgi:hypothetical protein
MHLLDHSEKPDIAGGDIRRPLRNPIVKGGGHMTRIIIEIDGKEVSSTTIPPTASLGAPPPELPARATALGALDAGSAPSGIASFNAAVVPPPAIDAGPSP